jgi:hypothetical protein
MKQLALLAAIAATSNAFASFDLGLVLQEYTFPNGPNQPTITRWDPVNRMELGRFAVPGFITTTKLMLDPSDPGVVTGATLSGGALRLNRYNYSTGQYLGQSTVSVSATAITSADMLSGGTMLLTGSNAGSGFARLMSSTGAIIRSYVLPSGTTGVIDAFIGDDGIVHVLSRQVGTTTGNKFTLTSHAPNSSAIAASLLIQDNTTTWLTNIVRQGNVLAVGAPYLSDRKAVTLSGTGLSLNGSFVGGYYVATSKILSGHGNMIHGFGYDSAQTRMYVSSAIIDNTLGDTYFFNTNAAYGNIYDAVVVVAPEPGTLLALGAGAAAMLRRRKRK